MSSVFSEPPPEVETGQSLFFIVDPDGNVTTDPHDLEKVVASGQVPERGIKILHMGPNQDKNADGSKDNQAHLKLLIDEINLLNSQPKEDEATNSVLNASLNITSDSSEDPNTRKIEDPFSFGSEQQHKMELLLVSEQAKEILDMLASDNNAAVIIQESINNDHCYTNLSPSADPKGPSFFSTDVRTQDSSHEEEVEMATGKTNVPSTAKGRNDSPTMGTNGSPPKRQLGREAPEQSGVDQNPNYVELVKPRAKSISEQRAISFEEQLGYEGLLSSSSGEEEYDNPSDEDYTQRPGRKKKKKPRRGRKGTQRRHWTRTGRSGRSGARSSSTSQELQRKIAMFDAEMEKTMGDVSQSSAPLPEDSDITQASEIHKLLEEESKEVEKGKQSQEETPLESTGGAETQILTSETASGAKSQSAKSSKKEKSKGTTHFSEDLGPALFSAPDIIRRVSTGEEVIPIPSEKKNFTVGLQKSTAPVERKTTPKSAETKKSLALPLPKGQSILKESVKTGKLTYGEFSKQESLLKKPKVETVTLSTHQPYDPFDFNFGTFQPRTEAILEPRIETVKKPRIETITRPPPEETITRPPPEETITRPQFKPILEPRIQTVKKPRVETITRPPSVETVPTILPVETVTGFPVETTTKPPDETFRAILPVDTSIRYSAEPAKRAPDDTFRAILPVDTSTRYSAEPGRRAPDDTFRAILPVDTSTRYSAEPGRRAPDDTFRAILPVDTSTRYSAEPGRRAPDDTFRAILPVDTSTRYSAEPGRRAPDETGRAILPVDTSTRYLAEPGRRAPDETLRDILQVDTSTRYSDDIGGSSPDETLKAILPIDISTSYSAEPAKRALDETLRAILPIDTSSHSAETTESSRDENLEDTFSVGDASRYSPEPAGSSTDETLEDIFSVDTPTGELPEPTRRVLEETLRDILPVDSSKSHSAEHARKAPDETAKAKLPVDTVTKPEVPTVPKPTKLVGDTVPKPTKPEGDTLPKPTKPKGDTLPKPTKPKGDTLPKPTKPEGDTVTQPKPKPTFKSTFKPVPGFPPAKPSTSSEKAPVTFRPDVEIQKLVEQHQHQRVRSVIVDKFSDDENGDYDLDPTQMDQSLLESFSLYSKSRIQARRNPERPTISANKPSEPEHKPKSDNLDGTLNIERVKDIPPKSVSEDIHKTEVEGKSLTSESQTNMGIRKKLAKTSDKRDSHKASEGKMRKTKISQMTIDDWARPSTSAEGYFEADGGKSEVPSKHSAKRQADEASELDSDMDDALSEASWNSEDDPDRLWCICRRPHNNRFMICCDVCEEWFHGKCVGITKAIGKQMEQDGLEWSCPSCAKKKKVDEGDKVSEKVKLLKEKMAQSIKEQQQKVKESQKTKTQVFSGKEKEQTESKERKAIGGSSRFGTSDEELSGRQCIMCRAWVCDNSIYCGDDCIKKHSNQAISQMVLESRQKTDSESSGHISQLDELKAIQDFRRGNTRIMVMDTNTKKILVGQQAPTACNLSNWLRENPSYQVVYKKNEKTGKYIVSSPKVFKVNKKSLGLQLPTKGTQLPSGQKERVQQPEVVKPTTQLKLAVSPGSKQVKLLPSTVRPAKKQLVQIISGTSGGQSLKPAIIVRPKQSEGSDPLPVVVKSPLPKLATKVTSLKASVAPKEAGPQKGDKMPRKKKAPVATITTKDLRQSLQKLEEGKEKEKRDGDQQIRDSVRKSLGDALRSRAQDCEDLVFTENYIDDLASEIEEKLFKHFENKTDTKYKSKYRSLVFNIKDPKNETLFRKILDNSFAPKDLVKLSPDELASRELARWREKENQHQLEMIKKTELELMTIGNTYIMKSHKGEQVIESGQSERVAAVAAEIDPNTPAQELVSALNSAASMAAKVVEKKEEREEQEEEEGEQELGQEQKKEQRQEQEQEEQEEGNEEEQEAALRPGRERRRRSSRERERERSRRERERRRGRSRSRSRSRRRRSKDRKRSSRDGDRSRTGHRDRKSPRKEKRDSSDSSDTRDSRDTSDTRDTEDSRDSEDFRRSRDRSGDRDSGSGSGSSGGRGDRRDDGGDRRDDRGGRRDDRGDRRDDRGGRRDDRGDRRDDRGDRRDDRGDRRDDRGDRRDDRGDRRDDKGDRRGERGDHKSERSDHRSERGERRSEKGQHKNEKSGTIEKVDQKPADEDIDEPSSTVIIKTPDINIEEPEPSYLWKGFIAMADVSKFWAIAREVSGNCSKLSADIGDKVDVVGRIPYDTVWEYIARMKKMATKDIIVIKILPSSENEKSPYSTLFTYLSHRSRIGVVGRTSDAVKDFYIYPLASHAPVPQVLLPLGGCGLDDERGNMLLGIIVRTRRKSLHQRSLPIEVSAHSLKSSSKSSALPHGEADKAPERSYTPPLPDEDKLIKKDPRLKRKIRVQIDFNKTPVHDGGDSPYSPGDSDEDVPPLPKISKHATPSASTHVQQFLPAGASAQENFQDPVEIQKKIEEMNRAIEEQTQEIQSLTSNVPKLKTGVPLPNISLLSASLLSTASATIPQHKSSASASISTKKPAPEIVELPLIPMELEERARSPPRSYTPPIKIEENIPFLPEVKSKVSLPINLQEMLNSIKKKPAAESSDVKIVPNPAKAVEQIVKSNTPDINMALNVLHQTKSLLHSLSSLSSTKETIEKSDDSTPMLSRLSDEDIIRKAKEMEELAHREKDVFLPSKVTCPPRPVPLVPDIPMISSSESFGFNIPPSMFPHELEDKSAMDMDERKQKKFRLDPKSVFEKEGVPDFMAPSTSSWDEKKPKPSRYKIDIKLSTASPDSQNVDDERFDTSSVSTSNVDEERKFPVGESSRSISEEFKYDVNERVGRPKLEEKHRGHDDRRQRNEEWEAKKDWNYDRRHWDDTRRLSKEDYSRRHGGRHYDEPKFRKDRFEDKRDRYLEKEWEGSIKDFEERQRRRNQEIRREELRRLKKHSDSSSN